MLQKSMLYLAAGAILALGVTPGWAQKQTLRMADVAGAAHRMVKAQEAWIKMIEEASGGNLTAAVDKAALPKPDGHYDLVKTGALDMAWYVPVQGRFEMLSAVALPLLCREDASVCSQALWAWYERYELADKEFTGTKLLTLAVHGPGTIHTLKPVKTLDEIKGIKIGTGAAGMPIARALGMSAFAMSATEAHRALSGRTVDGVLFPYEAVDSSRLSELIKAHLEVPGGLYTGTFALVMNKDAFAKLTPGNQAALMKVSGEIGSALFGKAWDEADAIGRDGAKSRGDTIQTLPPDELERWKPMLKFARAEWLKKAADRGYDGEEMLRELTQYIKCRGKTACLGEGP